MPELIFNNEVSVGDVIALGAMILSAVFAIISICKSSKAKESEEKAKDYLKKLEDYYGEASEYYREENRERKLALQYPHDNIILEFLRKKRDGTKSKVFANNFDMSIEEVEVILNRLCDKKLVRKNKSYWYPL